VLILALLTACTISESAFPTAFGKAACSRQERCDKGAYEDLWASNQDCIDAWANIAQLYLDAGALLGQTYDPAAGHDCVSQVRQADCSSLDAGSIECDLWQ